MREKAFTEIQFETSTKSSPWSKIWHTHNVRTPALKHPWIHQYLALGTHTCGFVWSTLTTVVNCSTHFKTSLWAFSSKHTRTNGRVITCTWWYVTVGGVVTSINSPRVYTFFFFFPLLVSSSVPLAHILHHDYQDDPTGVIWRGDWT